MSAWAFLGGLVLGGGFVYVREALAQSRQNRELGRQLRLLLDTGNVDRARKLIAGQATLTLADVEAIRAAPKSVPAKELVARYSIGVAQVSKIRRGLTHSWLK